MKAFLRFGPLALFIISVAIKCVAPDDFPLNDAWIYNFVIFATALSAFAVRSQEARALGSAILFWGIGSVIATYANYLGADSTSAQGIAQWSDLLYLLFYPALFSAITLRGQSRLHVTDIIDSLIIGLGLSAIGSALIVQPIINHLVPSDSTFAIASTIYPVADLTMLALFFAKTYQEGNRRNWNDGFMALGVLCFAISDATFLYQQSSYAYNNWLDYGWLLGLILMSESMHHHHTQVHTRERSIVPLVLAILASLSLLVSAALFPKIFPRLAIWPAAGTLVVALGRLAMSVRDARRLASEEVLARTDELTGLANRRRFVAALEEIRKGSDSQRGSIGLFIIDLDGFKEVNDSLGHEAGDQLLKSLANRLTDTLPSGALLARLGGDEFGVLINADERVIRLIGPALHAASAIPVSIQQTTVSVGASVGLSLSLPREFSPSEALRKADIAMYHAKAARTGFIEWSAQLDRRHAPNRADNFEKSQDLLHIYFQPIYQIAPRTLVAAEALLRFGDDKHALLLPEQFLMRFDGSEYQLTLHVLRESCIQLQSWKSKPLNIHINVESHVIAEPNFLRDLSTIASTEGVPLSLITLEITEKELLVDQSAPRLADLRAAGVRIAIDDFGSGYSSLSYLQKFPVDLIKLDQSLVAPLESTKVDTRAREVLRATVDLAARLNLQVVAEGIESAHALAEIEALDVNYAQGFHLGRPVDADEFGRLLSLPYA